MTKTAELSAAIETVYHAFRRCTLSGGIVVCKCAVCVSDEDEAKLNKTPLRQMSRALLAQYTNSAHGWDDGKIQDDFRYLLPRYLELIAEGELPTDSYDYVVLRRLADASYSTNWAADEIRAIDRYFTALVAARLNAPLQLTDYDGWTSWYGADVKQTLLIIANAGADITPLLALWEADRSREATLHLAAFASDEGLHWERKFSDWDALTEAGYRALFTWAATWENRQRIEDACLAETDPIAAQLLSVAEQNIAAAAWRRDRGE